MTLHTCIFLLYLCTACGKIPLLKHHSPWWWRTLNGRLSTKGRRCCLFFWRPYHHGPSYGFVQYFARILVPLMLAEEYHWRAWNFCWVLRRGPPNYRDCPWRYGSPFGDDYPLTWKRCPAESRSRPDILCNQACNQFWPHTRSRTWFHTWSAFRGCTPVWRDDLFISACPHQWKGFSGARRVYGTSQTWNQAQALWWSACLCSSSVLPSCWMCGNISGLPQIACVLLSGEMEACYMFCSLPCTSSSRGGLLSPTTWRCQGTMRYQSH